MPVDSFLRRFVTCGRLTVHWPDNSSTTIDGAPGPEAGLRFRDWATVRQVARNPQLRFGEAYVDGRLEPVGCTLEGLLGLLVMNLAAAPAAAPMLRGLRQGLGLLTDLAPLRRARRNVAHHYDLSGRLYALFLDRDLSYSCALFEREDATIEQAQAAKLRLIAAKLLLDRPGLEVLDIGSGWGGLARHLAQAHGARVTGITLSAEQLAEARARTEAAGLSERVRFELLDYREVEAFRCARGLGPFDRVVSVGMFEHVGVANYRRFLDTFARLLAEDGVGLLHHIVRLRGPERSSPWLDRYIFPGGYSPAISEVMPHIERSGLLLADIELLRLHYALTLARWRERFERNRDAIASLYDERFCRTWAFYLVGCEMAFRHDGHAVMQAQLSKRIGTVPITRRYLLTEAVDAD